MRAALVFFLALAATAQMRPVPPWIRQGGVVNDASHLPVTLPGGALAPGAIIAIDGLRFVPGKTSVFVEAGGREWPAQVLEATTDHIRARLPEIRNTGPAKVFVEVGGSRSVGSDVILAPAAFGIYTANQQGWGLAAGDSQSLVGTGLGRTSSHSIEIWLGRQRVPLLRHASENGRDTLWFRLPKGLTGCRIPLSVSISGVTGNTAALNAGTNPCAGEPARAPGSRRATLVLARSEATLELAPGKVVPFTFDAFLAGFDQKVENPPLSVFEAIPAAGTCTSWAGRANDETLLLPPLVTQSVAGKQLDLGPDIRDRTGALRDLDAGAVLTIRGPQGAVQAERSEKKPRIYSAVLGGNPPVNGLKPTPLFLNPGHYEVSIPGGADLGPATVSLEVPPMVRWLERERTTAVTRGQPLPFTWTASEGTAVVLVFSLDRRNALVGFTLCRAEKGSSGFTVPARAMANMPLSETGGNALLLGFAGVINIMAKPAQMPGLDQSDAMFLSVSGRSVVLSGSRR